MRTKLSNLLKPAFLIGAVMCCIYFSYHIGYIRGGNTGFCIAIDTVNKICAKQVKSDTTVSELVLVNRDTTVYFLSIKTVLGR